MYKIIGSFLLMFFIVGCGYKPSVYYTKEALGNNIYVDVSISRKDPKNSVLIKDALNDAVITRFGGRLSTKEMADTEIFLKIGSVTFTPILYDTDGYVTAYKAKVSLNINYESKNKTNRSLSTSGEYDFPIQANTVISDTKRFEAIKYASLDALNEFVSNIALQGMKK